MNISSMTSLFALCLLAAFLHTANAIQCYQCNSIIDPDCYSLEGNNTKFIKECIGDYGDNTPFCRKAYINIKDEEGKENTKRVVRSCGFLKYHIDCYSTDDDFHVETVCQCDKEKCNTGSRISQATTGVVFLSLLFIIVNAIFN